MPTLVRSYIDFRPDEQLHLVEAGLGPTVLLIHQTPRSWDEFSEVIELLAATARLVAMDLPGMGASTAPKAPASIEGYAAAAAHVVEHVGRGPMIICGHHTGGVVAMELAATRPELVESLVLSSTPWVDAAAREERAKKVSVDTLEPGSENRAAALREQRAPYYPSQGGYLDRFVCDALKVIDPAAGHRAVDRYEMERAAPRVKCDVLLVEHGLDPFARDHTADLAKALPHASVRKIAEGRIPLEATASQFAAIIADWVRARQAPRSSAPSPKETV